MTPIRCQGDSCWELLEKEFSHSQERVYERDVFLPLDAGCTDCDTWKCHHEGSQPESEIIMGGEAQPRELEKNEARATSHQPRCLLYSWTSTLVSRSVHYCLRLFELGCYLWPKASSLINSNSFFRSQLIGTSFKMPSLSCQFGRKAYPSCGQLLSHCIMALSRHGYLLHQTGP